MPQRGAIVVVMDVGAIVSDSHSGAGMRGRRNEGVCRPRRESGEKNEGRDQKA